MSIGFDIDGVVADLEGCLRRYFIKHNGYDIDASWRPRTFKIEVPGLRNSQVWDVINYYLSDQTKIPPYPDARQALRRFHELSGSPLFFLTARKDEFREETEKWLARNICVPFDLRMCGAGHEKCSLLLGHVTHFVEDRLRNANELAAGGVEVFLINHPWNQGRETHPGVTRVDNLLEVYEVMAPVITRNKHLTAAK